MIVYLQTEYLPSLNIPDDLIQVGDVPFIQVMNDSVLVCRIFFKGCKN